MMKVYLGCDDTETLDSNFGTDKLVRWFQKAMPQGAYHASFDLPTIYLLYQDVSVARPLGLAEVKR
jgi:hypothetical protein